jgi:hypothetical protein
MIRESVKPFREDNSMASQIFWLIPHRVVYWKLSGEVSGSEIYDSSELIAQLVDKLAKQKMHIVIDAINIRKLEHNNSPEARMAFEALARSQGIGQVVTVIHNYQIQINLNVLSRAFGLKWHNVSSIDDAIRILKTSDSSLQSVPKTPEKSPVPRPAPVEEKQVIDPLNF